MSCLKQVNLYLEVDATFFASPQVNFLKQAAKRALAKPIARKLPVTVDILLAIFKLLDFRHSLYVCMWAIFLVAFFSLLRKSNLVPITLADVTSDSATYVRICDASFHEDYCTLHVYKTRTIRSGRGPLKLCYRPIPNSVLRPVSALKRHLSDLTQDIEVSLFTVHTPTGFKPVTGYHFAKFLKCCIVNTGLDPHNTLPIVLE